MSAAGSAPRAGSIRSTGSCCSPRKTCAGRCTGCATAARRCSPTSTRATTSATPSWRWTARAGSSALRVKTLANVGAYVSSERNLLATFSNVGTLTGVYDIPAAHVAVLAVMANTNGTAPYRGAGRPEATYVIERLIDDAARELGLRPGRIARAGT